MENKIDKDTHSFLEKILDHKGIIFILAGIAIRIIMLSFFYYTHISDPGRSWGDVGYNFEKSTSPVYPPLSVVLLVFFREISFGSIFIFAFWAFFFDLLIMVMFYFVLKSFNIPKRKYVFGLFFINPFIFLNNSFSLENCGYHITDSFFFIFFFLALIFYSKKDVRSKYLFYLFLALSMAAKLYALPVVGFFFIKFLIEKDWDELKIFLISTVPILFLFLITPIFYWKDYLEFYFIWNLKGEVGTPLTLRIIPSIVIFGIYAVFRLKNADIFEITFFSIFVMSLFIFFSAPYIRYFQALLIFGILKPKEFFSFKLNLGFIERDVVVDNNLLVFYSSFILVGVSYLIIIFIL
ncbi:hypothetical protein LCGC14_0932000 [marine sediment metagenome]|uniref:Glycosyltransferase RgtA/B/C/D-like domain-containing protein n=1 Tax=marine sediment metagenome TaxID=412755 RepID=A0A0F9NMU2_9ZZZZ|nr:hypothetical protein [bacterium]